MPSPTTVKGELACLHLEKRAYEKGAIVSRPTIECGYDRLVDIERKIYRVQVKYAGGKSNHSSGVASVRLQRSIRNKNRTYDETEIDIVVCYLPKIDKLCWLPPDIWRGKTALMIRYEPTKNNQSKRCIMLDEYEW